MSFLQATPIVPFPSQNVFMSLMSKAQSISPTFLLNNLTMLLWHNLISKLSFVYLLASCSLSSFLSWLIALATARAQQVWEMDINACDQHIKDHFQKRQVNMIYNLISLIFCLSSSQSPVIKMAMFCDKAAYSVIYHVLLRRENAILTL